MTGSLNDAKSVGASGTTTQLVTGRGVVKAVYVTKTNTGDIAYFTDGTDATAVTQFQIEADFGAQACLINRTFANGIRVTFGGTTARYLVVFE